MAHFSVTNRCNLNCRYCFVKQLDPGEDLDTCEAKKVIHRMWELGIRIIAFFGGEPTLREDLVELVAYANRLGMVTQLSTNGKGYQDSLVMRLARAGLDIFQVSVDSDQGPAVSAKTLRSIEYLLPELHRASQETGMMLFSNSVLTTKNHGGVPDVIRAMHGHGFTTTVSYVCGDQGGSGLGFSDREEKETLVSTLYALIQLKKSGLRLQEPIAFFADLIKYVRGNKAWTCTAGRHSCAIGPRGHLKLCCGSPSESEEIMNDSVTSDYFRNRARQWAERQELCRQTCFSAYAWLTREVIEHPVRAFFAGLVGAIYTLRGCVTGSSRVEARGSTAAIG